MRLTTGFLCRCFSPTAFSRSWQLGTLFLSIMPALFLSMLPVFFLSMLLSGCAPTGPASSASHSGAGSSGPSSLNTTTGKKFRLAVIPKGTTHEFWKSVHFGAEKAAKELGNVEILWKGSALEKDTAGQIQVVEDFIAQKVDGICLAPLQSQSLVEYVETSVAAGIPVVIFDSGLEKQDKIVSYVATDNRKGGAMAAQRLAETLNKTGNVILLRYNQGSESTFQREEGFLDTIRRDYPEIRILLSEEYAGTTPVEALEKATQVLQKYRDEVQGIFAVCEPNATGVLGALQETGLAGKVKFVGFDPNEPLINGLKEHKVDGVILQDPVQMGYLTVMTMMKHLRGETVEKRISTGEFIATPENMGEPRMQQLLNPDRFGE